MKKLLLLVLLCLQALAGLCQKPDSAALHTIYFFPGMGLDERLFQRLHLPYKVRYITWLPIEKKESLAQYALRLASQIDTAHSYSLVGVSMGGMCVSEIAKVYKPKHVILVSSAKASDEIPFLLKTLQIIPLHRLLDNGGYVKLGYATRWFFGIRTKEESRLFRSMLEAMPPDYFPRAVECIVKWKNREPGPVLAHLHGDADLILPFRKINDPYRIEQGTHLMILTQPEKVEPLLLELLSR